MFAPTDERELTEWLEEDRAALETIARSRIASARLETRVQRIVEVGGVLVGAVLLALAATLGWSSDFFIAVPILTAVLVGGCEMLCGCDRSIIREAREEIEEARRGPPVSVTSELDAVSEEIVRRFRVGDRRWERRTRLDLDADDYAAVAARHRAADDRIREELAAGRLPDADDGGRLGRVAEVRALLGADSRALSEGFVEAE